MSRRYRVTFSSGTTAADAFGSSSHPRHPSRGKPWLTRFLRRFGKSGGYRNGSVGRYGTGRARGPGSRGLLPTASIPEANGLPLSPNPVPEEERLEPAVSGDDDQPERALPVHGRRGGSRPPALRPPLDPEQPHAPGSSASRSDAPPRLTSGYRSGCSMESSVRSTSRAGHRRWRG